MKLYICWSTGGSDHHACAKAYRSLTAHGYQPELIKVRGSGFLPGLIQTKGRKKIAKLTGKYFTPVLVFDDGKVINESDKIVAWAEAHGSK